MSDSLVIYLDRSNCINIIDPDALQHSDEFHPLINIAMAILIAGYEGVAVDELRLTNGRYVQALNVNMGTPEGLIISRLQSDHEAGSELPSAQHVLAELEQAYANGGCDE